MVDYKARGRKNRKSGIDFERKVRKDLEKSGYIICKWANNVDLEQNTIIPAKRQFNPFTKFMSVGNGFPDFIIYKPNEMQIIGVEVKSNNILSKEEKSKCDFYLTNKIFTKILIASKSNENNRKINYIEYSNKI
jgi:hypothetical protein